MTALAGALRLLLSRKLLWLIHLLGNAAGVLALWWWLGLPDETAGQIALSAVAAALLAVFFVWLHGAALAAFRTGAGVPWLKTLRRTPLLVLWLAIFVALCWSILRRAGPTPAAFLLAGALLLGMAPLASWLATGRGVANVYRSWQYYAGWLITLLIGYVPVMLIGWVPAVKGLNQQIWSAAIRLLLAYAIAVTAWLLLAAVIGYTAEVRGKAVAQPAQ